MGLTTRKLKVWVREHVLDIMKSGSVSDDTMLKPLPRHFRDYHDSNASGLKVKGIDKAFRGPRGGNWKKTLTQMESRWILYRDTIQPKGLNEIISFAPFL